jgi:MFS family permease
MKKTTPKIGFIAATLSLLMAFAASAAPIPLYDLYHRTNGVTYNELALTSVVYFSGAVSALLFLGRISNHLGRKPVAFIVFACATLSTIMFLDIDSAQPLIIGRFFLGLACGLASSAIAAYVADTAPSHPKSLASIVISNSPFIGLTAGALMSGALVEYAPHPRTLCYVVVFVGLAICAVLITFSKETVQRQKGLIQSLRPRLLLPRSDKRRYPLAAANFLATWAMGGFFQAYGPSIAAQQLGTLNTLMAAAVFSAYFLPGILGSALTARLSPAQAQRHGMVFFTLAVLGLIVSMYTGSIISFLITSVIAGASQGAVVTGSIRSLIINIDQTERAGILSTIFATSYTGAATTSLIAGQLSGYLSLFELILCYGGLAVIVCFITLAFAKEPNTTP